MQPTLIEELERRIAHLETLGVPPGILVEIVAELKKYEQAVEDLADAIKSAINSGDWKVDGACDPDAAIKRAESLLSRKYRLWA